MKDEKAIIQLLEEARRELDLGLALAGLMEARERIDAIEDGEKRQGLMNRWMGALDAVMEREAAETILAEPQQLVAPMRTHSHPAIN